MSAHVREFPELPKLPAVQKLLSGVQPLMLQLLCAGVAVLAANAPMFGALRPLALSFAVAVPAPYALAGAAGAAIGYALSLPMDTAVPYLAAIVAVGLLRALAPAQKRKTYTPVPALAGAACYFIVGAGLCIASGGGMPVMLRAASEALLIFGMAYLLRAGLRTPWRAASQMSAEARASLLFVLMAVLLCLAPYHAFGLQAAHIAGAGAALFAALCGREHSGALVGVAVSVALVAGDEASLYAGFGIAIAALAAGFFLQESRILTAMVFCGTGFLGVPLAPDVAQGLLYMAELVCGAALVLFLPQRVFVKAPVGNPAAVGRATLTTLAGRLDLVASALATVGTTLNAVCERLPRQNESYADVCDAVTETVCKSCARCGTCWGSGSSDAYDAFNKMQQTLQTRGYVTPVDLPEPMQGNCKLPKRLTSTLSTAYRISAQRRSTAARSRTMRAALTEQYSAMAAAIACLAGQVYREEMPDKRKARRVERLFCELGTEPMEVTVATDTFGCLHASVQLPRLPFSSEELAMLTKEVSSLCRCRFAPVRCENLYAATQLIFAEQAAFAPSFGVCILPARENISADVCKTFTDLSGSAHAILCDGMGTGRDAAIDGNLAAALSEKLMMAGFAASEAARLVNVALSLKGDADTGATLDALSVNLYTGKANLFKAGAAASFLVRADVVTVLEGESLPIGILGSVTGRASSIQMQKGDLIVMASDGAMAGGTDRICAMLTAAGHVTPQTLAQRIAEDARSSAKRPDDITVLCLALEGCARGGQPCAVQSAPLQGAGKG
ncbi:MAG: SpoIIE family protein phosphatase [Ruthenibacterium sp.]